MLDVNEPPTAVHIQKTKKLASVNSERSKTSDTSEFELIYRNQNIVNVKKNNKSSKNSKCNGICTSELASVVDRNHNIVNIQKNKKRRCINSKCDKTLNSSELQTPEGQNHPVLFQEQKRISVNPKYSKVSDSSNEAYNDRSCLSSDSSKCPTCKTTYDDFNSLVNHLCRPFPCLLCSASFLFDYELKMHKSAQHNDVEINKNEPLSEKSRKEIKCKFCGALFKTWGSLWAHKPECKARNLKKCDMCSKPMHPKNKSLFCRRCKISVIDRRNKDYLLRQTSPKPNLNILCSSTLNPKVLANNDMVICNDSDCGSSASKLNVNNVEDTSADNKSTFLNVCEKRKLDDISPNCSSITEQEYQPKAQKKKTEAPNVNKGIFSDSDKIKIMKNKTIGDIKNILPNSDVSSRSERNSDIDIQQHDLLIKKPKNSEILNFKDFACATSDSGKDSFQKSVRKKIETCNDKLVSSSRIKSHNLKKKLLKQALTKTIKQHPKESSESEEFASEDISCKDELNQVYSVKRCRKNTENTLLKGPSEQQLSQNVLSIESLIKSLPDSDSGILLLSQNKNSPSFICARCWKLFKVIKLASMHYPSCKIMKQKRKLVSLNEVMWLCTYCHCSFNQISGLNSHKKSCASCEVERGIFTDAYSYFKVKHIDDYKSECLKVCPKCGFSGTSPIGFQKHSCEEMLNYVESCSIRIPKFVIPNACSEETVPIYVCSVCEEIFFDVQLSHSHLFTHSSKEGTVISLQLHLNRRHLRLHQNNRHPSFLNFSRQADEQDLHLSRHCSGTDTVRPLQSHINHRSSATQMRIKTEVAIEENNSNSANSQIQNNNMCYVVNTFSSSQVTHDIPSVHCQGSSGVPDRRIFDNNNQINIPVSSNVLSHSSLEFSEHVTSNHPTDTFNLGTSQHTSTTHYQELSGMTNGNTFLSVGSINVHDSSNAFSSFNPQCPQPNVCSKFGNGFSSTSETQCIPTLNQHASSGKLNGNTLCDAAQINISSSPDMIPNINQQCSQPGSFNGVLENASDNSQNQENFRSDPANDMPSISATHPVVPEAGEKFVSYFKGLFAENPTAEETIPLSECRCKNAKVGPEGEKKPCPRCVLLPENNCNSTDSQIPVDSSFLIKPKEEILDSDVEKMLELYEANMTSKNTEFVTSQSNVSCENTEFVTSQSNISCENTEFVTSQSNISCENTEFETSQPNISCETTEFVTSQPNTSCKNNTFGSSLPHACCESTTSVTLPTETSYVGSTTSVTSQRNTSCVNTPSVISQANSSYEDSTCILSEGQSNSVPYQVLQTPRSCLTPPLTPGGIFGPPSNCPSQSCNIVDSQPSCSTDKTSPNQATIIEGKSHDAFASSSSLAFEIQPNSQVQTFYIGTTVVQIHATFEDFEALDAWVETKDTKIDKLVCAKCFESYKITSLLVHLCKAHNVKDKVINILLLN